jgi:hypothetical protein
MIARYKIDADLIAWLQYASGLAVDVQAAFQV